MIHAVIVDLVGLDRIQTWTSRPLWIIQLVSEEFVVVLDCDSKEALWLYLL